MKTLYGIFFLLLSVVTLHAQSLDRSIRPSSAPAKEINIKDARVFQLSNGLKVFLVEDKTTPIVYYSLQLDVKPQLQGDKTGLYDLFDEVFGKRTATRTKEQLNQDIDLIGARANAHRNGGSISFLKKYGNNALDIFTDMILHPVFAQEEFDLAMTQYQTLLSSLGDDAGQINERVSSVLTYGKNYPAGEAITQATLKNVQLPDMQAYYNTCFAPNVSRLVIIGDVTLKEAKANAQKYFGSWKKKTVPVTQYEIPSAPEGTRVAYVVKPGAVQSSIDISYPIEYQLGAPDYDAARVMDQIFGGSGTGRLFLNLREQHSYTYGIYSDLSPDEHIGRFKLTSGGGAASVKAAATDSAIYEIFNEMKHIRLEPVSEKELKSAKTYRAGGFSRSLEKPSTIANFAINIDKYHLPKDYYKNYLKRLEALTAEEVQAAAQKYIRPENAWIVVTGDRAEADKLLPFAGDQTIHYYDYDANPTEAPVTQEAGISVQQLIANYVEAMGGEAVVQQIQDYQVSAKMTVMGQQADFTQYFKAPNLSATTLALDGTVIQRIAFDGSVVRISGLSGSQEMTAGAEFESVKNESSLIPERNYLANGYTLTVNGIEPVNGKEAYVLSISKEGMSTSLRYFDIASGLPVKSETMVET
ncbi:MAG: insulinase family protein, partial [Candidatus Symbiothrix sp.]|nr:insulinase family protein [Candidatus Symbiothrix sp.]